MELKFNSVRLVGFGSYDDSTIDLNDRGFCLISGENRFKKDNALSNGSGKSTIFSAICYALCGETISGVSKNLKNDNLDSDVCKVVLDFNADNDHYVLTRIHKPKSDLKIIRNDIDESGKGIVESSAKLESLLPDLNKDLIASTILLGQGNVNKFSSFSPSGRKQLLEALTKSDFQIEDIKTRLSTRQASLKSTSQSYRDSIMLNQATIDSNNKQVLLRKNEIDSAVKPDFDREISEVTKQMTQINEDVESAKKSIASLEEEIEKTNNSLIATTEAKGTATSSLLESYTNATISLKAEKTSLESQIRTLTSELRNLRDNPDICPTCGQKLPNADHILQEKKDREDRLASLNERLLKINEELHEKEAKNAQYSNQIKQEFDETIAKLHSELTRLKNDLSRAKRDQADFAHYYDIEKEKLNKLTNDKNNWDSHLKKLKDEIDLFEKQTSEISVLVNTSTLALNDVTAHLEVLSKIESLIKRDFRGYLLEDIIKYIDAKAKEYCEVVFDTRELEVKIDGNNLNITYCNKNFDNLSGGEKQRVDIILQFAIRDLLQNYMNYSSNIIVLDEIFDALDAKSTQRILELISTRLKDIASVFVISHHPNELQLSYDTELRIVKNESGISEVVSM